MWILEGWSQNILEAPRALKPPLRRTWMLHRSVLPLDEHTRVSSGWKSFDDPESRKLNLITFFSGRPAPFITLELFCMQTAQLSDCPKHTQKHDLFDWGNKSGKSEAKNRLTSVIRMTDRETFRPYVESINRSIFEPPMHWNMFPGKNVEYINIMVTGAWTSSTGMLLLILSSAGTTSPRPASLSAFPSDLG